MNTRTEVGPPTAFRTAGLGCGTLLLRAVAPLLIACLWLCTPPSAHADGCDGCPTPTLTDLKKLPDFKLEDRPTYLGQTRRDYVILDAGACEGTIDGPPEIVIEDAWLALRATGEVWNCPHSKSVDTITVESAASDSTEWSFSVKLGTELGVVGASFKQEVEMGNTRGRSVTEVTKISKTIAPTFCHRIQWAAYFQVAQIKAVGSYTFRQTWAWWTKNTWTGSTTVHAKGFITMECGSGTLELSRQAPISGHFELSQRSCGGMECGHVVPKRLGFFPPWTPPGEPADGETDPPVTAGEEPLPGTDPLPEDPLTDPAAPLDPAAPDDPAAPADPAAPDEPDGPTSSADLGEAPTGPATDPHETTP